jgi:hypothetical protein
MPSHESPTGKVLRLASGDGSRYSHGESGGPRRQAVLQGGNGKI